MKTEFKVIQEYSSSDLEKSVQKLIDAGWRVVNAGYAKGLLLCWYAALEKDHDLEEYMR